MKKTVTLWALVCVCLFAAWQFSATDMPRFKNPLVSPAHAFYQSRDSNYNIAISSGGGGSLTWTTLGSGNTASSTSPKRAFL